MLDRSKLDLEFRLWRDRMESENLQDEIDSIPRLHFGFCEPEVFIHIPDLSWLHDIADDEELCTELISDSNKLIELS